MVSRGMNSGAGNSVSETQSLGIAGRIVVTSVSSTPFFRGPAWGSLSTGRTAAKHLEECCKESHRCCAVRYFPNALSALPSLEGKGRERRPVTLSIQRRFHPQDLILSKLPHGTTMDPKFLLTNGIKKNKYRDSLISILTTFITSKSFL